MATKGDKEAKPLNPDDLAPEAAAEFADELPAETVEQDIEGEPGVFLNERGEKVDFNGQPVKGT